MKLKKIEIDICSDCGHDAKEENCELYKIVDVLSDKYLLSKCGRNGIQLIELEY